MNTLWDIMEDEAPYISHGIPAVREVVEEINKIDPQKSEDLTGNNPENRSNTK